MGGIVGASGLFLTQIMCRAMNRSLADILLGKTSTQEKHVENGAKETEVEKDETQKSANVNYVEVVKSAKSVIIVPGYGMALAQAQHLSLIHIYRFDTESINTTFCSIPSR